LGPALSSLAETVSSVWSNVDGALMIPAATPPVEPEILKHARELLVGHVMNLDGINPLRQQACDSLSLAKRWASINVRAKNATAELASLQSRADLTDAQRATLASVKDQLVAVWKHLWEAEAAGDLAAISSGDLDSAEISLDRIGSGIEERDPQRVFLLDRTHLFPPNEPTSFSAFAPFSDLRPLPANDDRRLALLTAAHSEKAHRDHQTVELVWTGPETSVVSFRRTEQAILQVIDSAAQRVLVVSYAVYNIPRICEALIRAADRGAVITVIVETPDRLEGQNTYDTLRALGPSVAARSRVYLWPLDNREKDSNGKHGILHVKCAAADGRWLFLSSANLTEYAFTLNMELGLLITGGSLPSQVESHFDRLIEVKLLAKP